MVWGNFPACIAALAPHWRAHGLPALHGEECDGQLVLTDGATRLTLSPPDMCAAVWGAAEAPSLPAEWQPALPLPLCPYGLDFI